MKLLIYLSLALVLLANSCDSQYTKPVYVATSQPIGMILKQITRTQADVEILVSPGESPHTFSPKPSDAYKINSSKAVFYASDLLDGWIDKMEGGEKIEMIELVPRQYRLPFDNMHKHEHQDNNDHSHEHSHDHDHDHDHEELAKDTQQVIDPHFWTDPVTVKAMVDNLVDTLSVIDPENAGTYRANAGLFKNRLDLLTRQVAKILDEVKGKPVFLFHPSFRYMINRFELVYAGAIETSPGKEPSPKYLNDLIKKINDAGAKAIFTEPQLSREPAEAIAESATVLLFELDPIGGVEGRNTYTDLIIYNARILRKALK